MVLRNSRAVEKLAKENRTLAQTIADWLHGFYEDIKEAFAGVEARSKEAKAMTDYMDELVKLWDDALIKASKGEGKQSGKAKQQARDARGNVVVDENVTLQSVRKTLEDIFSGKHKKQSFTFPVLKHTPQVFMDYCRLDGDRSFVMDSKKAYKAMQSNAEHQHSLGVDGMIAVIQNLHTPLYILEQTKGPNAGHYVAIVEVEGKDVVAAVDLGDYRTASAGVAGESGYYNVLITAFYPMDAYIDSNLFDSENIVVYDAEVDKKYEIPTQVASGESPFGHAIGTSKNSIRESDTEVKYSKRDSEGNTLSQKQQEYFKDSKVRNAEGKLLVMYRGGKGDFTVFDRKKSKPSNLYGRGFYFTNSKNHAEQYGNARPFYLNLKHPLSNGHEISRSQLLAFLKAIEEDGEDYDLYNYGEGATAESVLEKVWSKNRTDFQMLNDINTTAIGDLVAATELFNSVNGTDYDGFILNTETVTFRSEQAKNVDNASPTSNPDIRYSRRDSSEGLSKEEARAQALAYTRLRAENAALERRLEYWIGQSRQSKQRSINRKDVEKYARQLVKMHSSTADPKWIKNQILALGDYTVFIQIK